MALHRTQTPEVLQFAVGVSVVLASIAILLVLTLLALRIVRIGRAVRKTRVVSQWRPRMLAALEAVPRRVPHPTRSEQRIVIYAWNQLHQSLRGEATRGLHLWARRAGLDAIALRFLHSRHFLDRLLGAATLGHMGDRRAWPSLEAALQSRHDTTSSMAARAMMDIDPQRALPLVLPVAGSRRDWSPTRLAGLFHQLDAEQLARVLSHLLHQADERVACGLVRYLEMSPPDAGLAPLRHAAETCQRPAVLAAALRAWARMTPGDARHAARRHLDAARPLLRAAAADALGETARPDDALLLQAHLPDPDPWVGYRAARALGRIWNEDPAALRTAARAASGKARQALLLAASEVELHRSLAWRPRNAS